MRFVDDYILVTRNKAVAKKFIVETHKGFAKNKGPCINASKSLANFDIGISGSVLENSTLEHG
eukprot:Awhi_evm1s12345